LSTGGPEAEEERGIFGDCSGDGLCGFVGRASSLLGDCQLLHLGGGNASTYDHGVQAGTGEASGADEVLSSLEESLEVGLVSEGNAVRLGCAIVEALVDSSGGGERSREGQKIGGAHCGVFVFWSDSGLWCSIRKKYGGDE
jgi:hypothetical protein